MKGLIAKRPILYRGRMYRDGENLPGDDTRMVAAWLENDSAELCGAEQDTAMGGREEAQEPPRGPENTPEVSGIPRARERQTAARRPGNRPERAKPEA